MSENSTKPSVGDDSDRVRRPDGRVGRGLWFYALGSAALGLAAWAGYLILAGRPAAAEFVAGRGPIPAITRGLSLLTGIVPIPLAELMIAGFVVRHVVAFGREWGATRSGTRSLPAAGARGALRVAGDIGVLVFLFYLLWGFQYARPGLAAHVGIASTGQAQADELRPLTERAIALTNDTYLEIHGTEDAGVPTPRASQVDLVRSLQVGWERIQADLELGARVDRVHGAPKQFLASPLVKRLGVAGMYFPYTGEALVLNDLPGVLQGKDLGHEMAHQRGFSSESEANALGYLVAVSSPDPRVRYSAYSFLQRQLLSALQQASREQAREVARARLPGVERDLVDLSDYWRPAQTPVRQVAERLNDAMLRSHGIPEGIRSYSGSTWLFVALARELGEDALFRDR